MARRGGGRRGGRPGPRHPGGGHRRRHHRHRRGPQFIPYAVGVPVPVYDEVDYDDYDPNSQSEAVLDAFLALMDSQTEEDAALMGMERFGGSKWKKKYSAAKKSRKAAEEKLASCKEAAEEKAKSSEEEASSDEPVSEPTMENGEEPASGPEPSSATQEKSRQPEEPVIEPVEEAEESPVPEDGLAELWAEAAEEDAADDDFGILVQETTSMLRRRPTQVLDVFAASLSALPQFRNSTPMHRGGLTEPGDYDHQVYPKGFPVQYHEDLEGHLSETDELVDSIRDSFGNIDW
jgi:hypothetical protein